MRNGRTNNYTFTADGTKVIFPDCENEEMTRSDLDTSFYDHMYNDFEDDFYNWIENILGVNFDDIINILDNWN
jgi:hypothetical protein